MGQEALGGASAYIPLRALASAQRAKDAGESF